MYLENSDGKPAVVYEVQEGFKSNLYVSYYENDEWSEPLPLTDFDEKMRSWSAWLGEDGEVYISAVLAKINVTDDDFTQDVRLAYTAAEPIESISALYIASDDDIKHGKTARFNIGVENNSRAEEFNVTITGDKCGELYSETVTASDELSVSVTIPEDFEKQTLTATITGASKTGKINTVVTNNSCEDAENVVLTVKDEDGNVICTETIGTLAAGEKFTVNTDIDEKHYTLAGQYDKNLMFAEVTSDTEETAEYNNSDCYTFENLSLDRITLNETGATLKIGETYLPDIEKTSEDMTMYVLSDNTEVATVDANGLITAVANGRATITYMAANGISYARMTVYVHERNAPEITSAVYNDYGDEDDVRGEVSVTVNTSECLAEGETEYMIAAAYAEDGTLVGVRCEDATAAEENNIYISTSGKKPKRVKVMLWNSISGMKPVSYAAETDITTE